MAKPQTAYDVYKEMMGFKSDAEAAAHTRKLKRKSLIATNLPVSELFPFPYELSEDARVRLFLATGDIWAAPDWERAMRFFDIVRREVEAWRRELRFLPWIPSPFPGERVLGVHDSLRLPRSDEPGACGRDERER